MTTKNIMDVVGMGNNVNVQGVNGNRKKQEEEAGIEGMFSIMVNVNTEKQFEPASDSDNSVEMTATESYERYQYKEPAADNIEKTNETEMTTEYSDDVQELEEGIIKEICEQFNVTEQDVRGLLDQLGIETLELLNPKEMADFIMQLTGIEGNTDLLLNVQFQELLQEVTELSETFMQQNELGQEEFQQIITRVMEENNTQLQDMPQEQMVEQTVEIEVESNVETDLEVGVEVEMKDELSLPEEESKESLETETIQVEKVEMGEEVSNQLSGNESETPDHMLQQEPGFVSNQSTTNTASQTMTTSTYTSVDTVELIQQINQQITQQIAQQIKVSVSQEFSSMEMQLNPENLGKIYLNISTTEGAVKAHLDTQNEIVREALEMQVLTLKDNLEQAGVKVDSIEVTVGAHEFERNLEQNQKQDEQNAEYHEKIVSSRKSLHVDTLDEMMGVMTEEERLVAQIMKDNGNSMDMMV